MIVILESQSKQFRIGPQRSPLSNARWTRGKAYVILDGKIESLKEWFEGLQTSISSIRHHLETPEFYPYLEREFSIEKLKSVVLDAPMKSPRQVVCASLLSVFVGVLMAGCGEHHEKVNIEAQRQALKAPGSEARAQACIELAKAGPSAAPAVKELIAVTSDPDPTTRKLAAYALGQIGSAAKEAVPRLKEMMDKDQDRDVYSATVNALRAIDPAAAGGATVPNVSN